MCISIVRKKRFEMSKGFTKNDTSSSKAISVKIIAMLHSSSRIQLDTWVWSNTTSKSFLKSKLAEHSLEEKYRDVTQAILVFKPQRVQHLAELSEQLIQ